MPTTSKKNQTGNEFLQVQDLEVSGRVMGPQFQRIFAAIDGLVAHNEVVTLGNSVLRGTDPIPASSELFDLRQPDCLSSLGRVPTYKQQVFFPATHETETGVKYNNLRSKFAGAGTIGVYKVATNLVLDPENLTTANWPNTDSTDAASIYTWDSRAFTLVTASATTGGVTQTLVATSGEVHCLSVIVKKGTGATTQVLLRDSFAGTVRADVTITWATPTAAASTGVVFLAEFYASNTICELSVISTAIGSAAPTVTLRPDTTAGTGTAYFTAVQVEQSTYPTPYIPTSRIPNYLAYSYPPAQLGAIEFWVRPWWNYDIGVDAHVMQMGLGLAPRLRFWYDFATDKFAVHLSDNTNRLGRTSDTAYNNLGTAGLRKLWDWIHFKIEWDVAAKTLRMWTNGVEDTTTDHSGTLSSWAPSPYLFLGVDYGYGNATGMQLTELLIWATADVTTTHYTSLKSWSDPREVTNSLRSVRINDKGIRLHNASLTLSDNRNRLIDISNQAGLLARDAAGTVIHDIGNAPIQNTDFYLGHTSNLDGGTLVYYGDPGTTWATEFSPVLKGNTNVRGLWLECWIWGMYTKDAELTDPNYSRGWASLSLRPSGTSWTASGAGATRAPTLALGARPQWLYVGGPSQQGYSSVFLGGILWCPLGSDGNIDVYGGGGVNGTGGTSSFYTEIWQIGTFV